MFNLNIDLLKPVINGAVLATADVSYNYYNDRDMGKQMMKLFGVDFAVMGGATLVNELLVNTITLPSFLQSLKNLYGVDVLTVVLFVAVKFMLPSPYKGSIIKNSLLGVGTVLASNYIETPLRPYAPSFLLPKV